jgi:hypothetical protein
MDTDRAQAISGARALKYGSGTNEPSARPVLVADGVSLQQAGRRAAILGQGSRLGVGPLMPGVSVEAAPSWSWMVS